MLTYEEVIHLLVQAAEEAGLRLYDEQSWLDTISLERSYRVLAVPTSDHPPHRVRAEISFPWPIVYSVESTHGPTCCLYHDPGDPCPHQETRPEATLTLEIRYLLDVKDAATATDVGARVRSVIERELEYDIVPQIHFAIAEEGDGPLSVTEVTANTWWEIDLGETLDAGPVMREVARVIDALLKEDIFPKGEAAENDPELGGGWD